MGRRRRGGQRARPSRPVSPSAGDAGESGPTPSTSAPNAGADRPAGTPSPEPSGITSPAADGAGNAGQGRSPGAGNRGSRGNGNRQNGNRQNGNRARNRNGKRPRWMRQVNEFSAGGLVVDLDGDIPRGALIARTDRHGRLLWSLPKGHIEAGETPQQAAVREVEEETGIAGIIMAELGTIDFWFVAEDRRIHKTVQHYLMRATGGELSDADIEVTEVAWVPLSEIRAQLAYPDERGLVDTAGRLIADTA